MDIIRGIDVVVDCADSIATRLIVNSACLKQDIPLVEGGEPLFSKMLTYDGLRNSFVLIELKKDDQCGEFHNS